MSVCGFISTIDARKSIPRKTARQVAGEREPVDMGKSYSKCGQKSRIASKRRMVAATVTDLCSFWAGDWEKMLVHPTENS